MILSSLDKSYNINSDGTMRSPVAITAPNSDVNYSKYAQSAVVAGQLYLFGGDGDNRKVDNFNIFKI